MTTRRLTQVDVFAHRPLGGNPVAVVHDAEGLCEEEMAAFARWTNLSETTFLLPPTDPRADYRLRIFTPLGELPFAGHPTLGSAHAWLAAGGEPAASDLVVQECGIGIVQLRRTGDALAFRVPALLRSGPVDPATLDRVIEVLGVDPDRVLGSNWVDNGPGWIGLELVSAADVLALRPDFAAMEGLDVGVIAPLPEDERDELGADYEVRAFCPGIAVPEDPVTGSLNAGLASWLVPLGRLPSDYVVRQGTVLNRDGRVQVSTDQVGDLWVGGACHSLIEGHLTL